MLSWWWENDARQVLSCAYDCQVAETSDSDRMISLGIYNYQSRHSLCFKSPRAGFVER
jgi:hypothetical protein